MKKCAEIFCRFLKKSSTFCVWEDKTTENSPHFVLHVNFMLEKNKVRVPFTTLVSTLRIKNAAKKVNDENSYIPYIFKVFRTSFIRQFIGSFVILDTRDSIFFLDQTNHSFCKFVIGKPPILNIQIGPWQNPAWY